MSRYEICLALTFCSGIACKYSETFHVMVCTLATNRNVIFPNNRIFSTVVSFNSNFKLFLLRRLSYIYFFKNLLTFQSLTINGGNIDYVCNVVIVLSQCNLYILISVN